MNAKNKGSVQVSKESSENNKGLPLLLRCNRLMEAFAKSDDERDFYLDCNEGYILFIDLDKSESELLAFQEEFQKNSDRYLAVPKLTFFETKKIMEGFINEKVYDIDIKEKLSDIIQSKDARENFLECINDNEIELEKWLAYYQERFRVRIIEWLRSYKLHFVFEEDLDFTKSTLEKLKLNFFESKLPKELETARKVLETKAKVYYSNEALNPRPKRGRPPKQAAKPEAEVQVSADIYTSVPPAAKPFLFTPDVTVSGGTFSSRFDTEEKWSARATERNSSQGEEISIEEFQRKLAELRSLSSTPGSKG